MTESMAGRLSSLLLAALLLAALPCAAPAADQSRFSMSGIAGGRAILSFAADRLLTLKPTPFHLILTDLAGDPITGAKVRCEFSMPAMAMPENRPPLREADGAYWGETLFTMPGRWRADFHVEMPDGRLEILVFDIDRVRLK